MSNKLGHWCGSVDERKSEFDVILSRCGIGQQDLDELGERDAFSAFSGADQADDLLKATVFLELIECVLSEEQGQFVWDSCFVLVLLLIDLLLWLYTKYGECGFSSAIGV